METSGVRGHTKGMQRPAEVKESKPSSPLAPQARTKPESPIPAPVGDAVNRVFEVVAKKSGLDDYSSLWTRSGDKASLDNPGLALSALFVVTGLSGRSHKDGDSNDHPQKRQMHILVQQMQTSIPASVLKSAKSHLQRLPKRVLFALVDTVNLASGCSEHGENPPASPSFTVSESESHPNTKPAFTNLDENEDAKLGVLDLLKYVEVTLENIQTGRHH